MFYKILCSKYIFKVFLNFCEFLNYFLKVLFLKFYDYF